MTDIRQLMRLCEREEISVETNELNYCESFSFMLDGSCFIVLDAKLPERLVKEHAAHEAGHCIMGAFYNRSAALDLISQHEYRADKWAIETLVPREELEEQISRNNLDSLYLLSEHFAVSEDFIKKACIHYGLYIE